MTAQTEQQPLSELLPGLLEAVTAVAKLEVPDPSDIYYYRNIPEYKSLSTACSNQVQQLLQSARINLTRPTQAAAGSASVLQSAQNSDSDEDVAEGLYEVVVAVLDDTLEQLDTALDASKTQTEKLQLGGWAPAPGNQHRSRVTAPGLESTAAGLSSSRVQRYNASLARPQDIFPDPIDNSNTPWDPSKFPYVSKKRAAAAANTCSNASSTAVDSLTTSVHPYAAEFASIIYQPWQLTITATDEAAAAADANTPATAGCSANTLDSTPFTFVDTPEALAAMVQQLQGVKQLALDLEHHSYRSYQGFTCLLQVSTRTADWVVDTLSLRGQLGSALADVLADPAVEKVLHGADSDIQWLQRDFGLFIVNLFDTGQAARVLNYPSASLAHLLEKHAGYKADKRYQLADWRVRPLPADMLHYARCDTHFLLGIADTLRAELLSAGRCVPAALEVAVPVHSGVPQGALGVVLERSRRLCATLYQKPAFTNATYLEAATRWGLTLAPRNMAAFAALLAWRDRTARALDESTGYVMPKAVLVELARKLPESAVELRSVINQQGFGFGGNSTSSNSPLSVRAEEVVQVIVNAKESTAAATTAAAAASISQAQQEEQHHLHHQQQLLCAQAGISAGTQGAADAASGAVSRPEVVPRQLPPLKPRALPPLAARAGRPAPATSVATTKSAAGASSSSNNQEQQPQQVQQQPFVQQPRQQQQLKVNKAGSLASSEQKHQQPEQQVQQQQQAAGPAPKQLTPRKLASRPTGKGSSMAVLLAARPGDNNGQHNKQLRMAAAPKAVQLKAQQFKLAFLQDSNTAVMPSAAHAQDDKQVQQHHHQQEADQIALAISGAEVRAVVDQWMAEADAGQQHHQQQQQQQQWRDDRAVDVKAVKQQDSDGGPKTATRPAAGDAAADVLPDLADLDYVPLAQMKFNSKTVGRKERKGRQNDAIAATLAATGEDTRKRRKVVKGKLAAATAAAASDQPQEQLQQSHKRGIFAAAASSGSDTNSSSSDGKGPSDFLQLPTAVPGQMDSASMGQQKKNRKDADQPAADSSSRGRGGRGRGRRDSRGRGSRDRGRSGFLAAAGASLAAVRRSQGAGGILGPKPFAIPDANLMRGGKRSAVAPRQGNRSASFTK